MERSILIVDDDHDVADLLADLLDEEGYRVRCAFDDQAALREIAREAPDVQFVPKSFDLEYIIDVIARILKDLGR